MLCIQIAFKIEKSMEALKYEVSSTSMKQTLKHIAPKSRSIFSLILYEFAFAQNFIPTIRILLKESIFFRGYNQSATTFEG